MMSRLLFILILFSSFLVQAQDTLKVSDIQDFIRKKSIPISLHLYEAVRLKRISGYAVYDTLLPLSSQDLDCWESLEYDQAKDEINTEIREDYYDLGCEWENYSPNLGLELKFIYSETQHPKAIVIAMNKSIGYANLGIIDRLYIEYEQAVKALNEAELSTLNYLYQTSKAHSAHLSQVYLDSNKSIYTIQDRLMLSFKYFGDALYEDLVTELEKNFEQMGSANSPNPDNFVRLFILIDKKDSKLRINYYIFRSSTGKSELLVQSNMDELKLSNLLQEYFKTL